MANHNAPWNKGLTKEDDPRVGSGGREKGCVTWMKGKRHTQATKELMSTIHRGQISPMKGKHHTQEAKAKIGCKGGPIWSRRKMPSSRVALLRKQGYLCAICGVKLIGGNGMQSVSADHDHTTGAYRGILCKRCNILLGLANEEPTTLSKAAEYLNSWKGANERNN